MNPPADRVRRAIFAAAIAGVLSPLRAGRAQAGATRIEGGTPHGLPLAAVDDLEIELAASDGDEPVDLAVLLLGAIDLPSGRLAAGDGIKLDGGTFVPTVPAGRYPLQVVVARFADDTERVAFVQVKFSDRNATDWSNAIFEGDDAGPLEEEDELSGYEVESGLACLFDARALQSYGQELAQSPRLRSDLEGMLAQNRRAAWSWAWVRTPVGSGVLVTSGSGAGFYGSYWGKDASGTIVSLVTDFELLDWVGLPEEPPVTA